MPLFIRIPPPRLPERAAPGLRRVVTAIGAGLYCPPGNIGLPARSPEARPTPLGAVVQVPRLPPLHLAPVTDGASRRPQGRGQRLASAPLRDAPAWTLGAGFLPPLAFRPGCHPAQSRPSAPAGGALEEENQKPGCGAARGPDPRSATRALDPDSPAHPGPRLIVLSEPGG